MPDGQACAPSGQREAADWRRAALRADSIERSLAVVATQRWVERLQLRPVGARWGVSVCATSEASSRGTREGRTVAARLGRAARRALAAAHARRAAEQAVVDARRLVVEVAARLERVVERARRAKVGRVVLDRVERVLGRVPAHRGRHLGRRGGGRVDDADDDRRVGAARRPRSLEAVGATLARGVGGRVEAVRIGSRRRLEGERPGATSSERR